MISALLPDWDTGTGPGVTVEIARVEEEEKVWEHHSSTWKLVVLATLVVQVISLMFLDL